MPTGLWFGKEWHPSEINELLKHFKSVSIPKPNVDSSYSQIGEPYKEGFIDVKVGNMQQHKPVYIKLVRIEGMEGTGLSDVWKSIKSRIGLIGKVRTNIEPKGREVLKKYGSDKIVTGYVCRKPLNKVLSAIVKLTTNITYDKLFHLSTMWKLSSGRIISVQKNEVVDIKEVDPSKMSKAECLPLNLQNIPSGLTLWELIKNTQNRMGSKFGVYDAITNNCQVFIKNVLEANNIPVNENFILQKVYNQVSEPVSKLFKTVTDIASSVNLAIQGRGVLQSIVFPKNVWTEKQAKKWIEKHGKDSGKDVHETTNTYRFRQSDPIFRRYATRVVYHKTLSKKHGLRDRPIELVIGYD